MRIPYHMKHINKFFWLALLIVIFSWLTYSCSNTQNISDTFESNLKSEICMVKNNVQSIVTIIEDDGQYFEATKYGYNEYFKQFGLSGTIAMVYTRAKDMGNEKGWKEIAAEGYLEIESHSYSHMTMRYPSDRISGDLTSNENENGYQRV